MTKRWKWIVGGLLALCFGTAVLAQNTLTSPTLSGNEAIEAAAGGGGGSAFFVPVSQLRNATALKIFSGSGVQTYTATPLDSTLYWSGTAPTSWTVTTPASPVDGEILTIATDTTLTTMVTLTANTGQSLNQTYTSQTLNAKTSVEFQYNLATTKWFQMR
jgi:hypothetical protein